MAVATSLWAFIWLSFPVRTARIDGALAVVTASLMHIPSGMARHWAAANDRLFRANAVYVDDE